MVALKVMQMGMKKVQKKITQKTKAENVTGM